MLSLIFVMPCGQPVLNPQKSSNLANCTVSPVSAKSNGNKAGWCKLFNDGLGGSFGDFSSGLSENWQAKRDKPYSPSERAAFLQRAKESRAQAEAERKEKYTQAAEKAAAIWNEAESANKDHPYLSRKGIEPNGARLHEGCVDYPDAYW